MDLFVPIKRYRVWYNAYYSPDMFPKSIIRDCHWFVVEQKRTKTNNYEPRRSQKNVRENEQLRTKTNKNEPGLRGNEGEMRGTEEEEVIQFFF